MKLDPDYRNVEFLITTGPGPCPELDNQNIVFGSVLDGKQIFLSLFLCSCAYITCIYSLVETKKNPPNYRFFVEDNLS